MCFVELTRALAQQMLEKQLRIPSVTSLTAVSTDDVKLTGINAEQRILPPDNRCTKCVQYDWFVSHYWFLSGYAGGPGYTVNEIVCKLFFTNFHI